MATRTAAIPTGSGIGPLIDVLIVAGVSALVFLVEAAANARGLIPLGEVVRGAPTAIAGALTAITLVRVRGGSLADLGFTRPACWPTVPFWVLGMLAVFVAGELLTPVLVSQFITLPQPDLSRYDSIAGSLPAAIVMALLLPLTASAPEEIIYRGFLIRRLEHVLATGARGTAVAVFVQALLFGAAHFQWGLGGMLVTTIMGLVWGAGFVLCGRNLWIVIMAHSAGHMLGVVQLYLSKSIII